MDDIKVSETLDRSDTLDRTGVSLVHPVHGVQGPPDFNPAGIAPAEIIPTTYSPAGCRCGAHRLHRVFRFAWEHPSASRKDCAKALKMSYNNVLGAFFRLRKRDLTRYCVECFEPMVFNGVCERCGVERDAPIIPTEILRDSQSPTNWLLPGNMLGSETDYDSIGFVNHGMVLKRRMERGIEDILVIAVKSDVENELKRIFPGESITDEAGRLVVKEATEFRGKYPKLAKSKKVRKQLVSNVIGRLVFLHPHLRAITRLPEEGML